MQTREEVRRRSLGLRRLAAAVVFTVVLGGAASAPAVLVVPPGPEPGARPRMSRWLDVPVYALGEGRMAGASISCCHPYMIEGLLSCAALAGFRAREGEAWANWLHIGHELYREDRLTMSLGARLPGRFRSFSFRVVPAVERRAVRGFPSRVAEACSFSLAYEHRRSLLFAVEWAPYDECSGASSSVRSSIGARMGAVWVSVSRIVSGEGSGDTTARCAAAFLGRIAIVSSYRSSTAELTCGLVARTGPFTLDLSWSYHPALGKTVAAGFGRWWAW